jgi:hypothetical protein
VRYLDTTAEAVSNGMAWLMGGVDASCVRSFAVGWAVSYTTWVT